MDRILAEDGDLVLDGSLDLPSLPLLLLPVPTQRVLSPEPVVAPPADALPDLSREGPFDASQGTSVSGASPPVLDSLPGCQYHINHDEAVSAALQLQRDAGLMMTNLQVLSQFVTSLNRMSSEVMWLSFGHEQYPANAMQCRHLHVFAGQPIT